MRKSRKTTSQKSEFSEISDKIPVLSEYGHRWLPLKSFVIFCHKNVIAGCYYDRSQRRQSDDIVRRVLSPPGHLVSCRKSFQVCFLHFYRLRRLPARIFFKRQKMRFFGIPAYTTNECSIYYDRFNLERGIY